MIGYQGKILTGLLMAGGLLVLGIVAGTCAPATCHALEPADFDASNPEHALALDVARLCMNEAPGSPADCALIWQVVESRARSTADRHAWLRRHSPAVTRQLSAQATARRPGNVAWTSQLDWADARPLAWPVEWDWDRGLVTWRRTRLLVWGLMTGRVRRRPCTETPETWGGRHIDMPQAVRRGLVPLDCEGTYNEGFKRSRPPGA